MIGMNWPEAFTIVGVAFAFAGVMIALFWAASR